MGPVRCVLPCGTRVFRHAEYTAHGFYCSRQPGRSGLATSTSYVFRSTGSAFSVVIASAVFQNLLKWDLALEFGDTQHGRSVAEQARRSVGTMRKLHGDERAKAVASYVRALGDVWASLLAFAVAAVVVGLFNKEHPLHKEWIGKIQTSCKRRRARKVATIPDPNCE